MLLPFRISPRCFSLLNGRRDSKDINIQKLNALLNSAISRSLHGPVRSSHYRITIELSLCNERYCSENRLPIDTRQSIQLKIKDSRILSIKQQFWTKFPFHSENLKKKLVDNNNKKWHERLLWRLIFFLRRKTLRQVSWFVLLKSYVLTSSVTSKSVHT